MKPATLLQIIALALLPAVAGAEEYDDLTLGRFNVQFKLDRIFFSDDVKREWGVGREPYYGIEMFYGDGDVYIGGEFGYVKADDLVNEAGDVFQWFRFYSFEANGKMAFGLYRGLSCDVGVGLSFFWVEGMEVVTSTYKNRLADVGTGWQLFADLNWRTGVFFAGLNFKFHYAFDIIAIDYSNYRLGGHVGFAF